MTSHRLRQLPEHSLALFAVASLLLPLSCGAGEGPDGPPAFTGAPGAPGAGTAPSAAPNAVNGVPSGTAASPAAPPSSAGQPGAAPTGSEPTGAGDVGLQPGQADGSGQTGQNNGASMETAGAGGSSMATPPGSTGGAAGTAAATGSGGASSLPPPSTNPPPVTNPPASSPPVSNPPPATANAGCPGQFLCEGFEAISAGTSPGEPWDVIDGYGTAQQSTKVQVSAANAHSGGQALRVTGSGSRNGVVTSLPQSQYFVRAWLQLDSAPGGPVFMGLGTDQGSEIRLRSFNSQAFGTINVIPGDAIRPGGATSGNCPGCTTLPANRWFCAEFFIDNAAQTATLWIDGVETANVVNGDAGWAPQPAQPNMFLGIMSLQGGDTSLWIDDVAAGPERIGCN